MKQPSRWYVVAVVVLLAVSAACGGGDERSTTTRPRRTTTTTAPPSGPIGPLTGGPVDPSRLERPALIVKIDNAPKGRPQAGINSADIVVEEMVEGGITRLAAIYHSNDADPVGPVRSARSTDIAIATALNRPLFAYSGANADFVALVRSAPLVDVGVALYKDAYRRESGRPQLYNLFSTTAQLYALAPADAAAPPPMFQYRAEGETLSAEGAEGVTGVAIEWKDKVTTAAEWTWDGASGTWQRVQNGTAHVDADDKQVSPRNVVVQFVDYRDTGYRDQSGSVVPEAELVGEGEAWILSDGKIVRGRWTKPAQDAATAYLDSAGNPIKLTPGQTWLELPRPGTARTL